MEVRNKENKEGRGKRKTKSRKNEGMNERQNE